MPMQQLPDSLKGYELELIHDGNEMVYTFNSQQVDTGIAQLLKKLDEADIAFRDMKTSESSLEEIFVNLVKKQ